jgi:hypothetical protein
LWWLLLLLLLLLHGSFGARPFRPSGRFTFNTLLLFVAA